MDKQIQTFEAAVIQVTLSHLNLSVKNSFLYSAYWKKKKLPNSNLLSMILV